MKQVKKTLLTLVLVAASAFTIGSALARPPGGGPLPPQPPQPPIGAQHYVYTCIYEHETLQFETSCLTSYNGQMLLMEIYGPVM